MSLMERTFLIRLAVVGLCGWITLEIYRICHVIDSGRLRKVFYKVFVAFLIFTFARLIASFADNYFQFSVGLFSNIVNFAFYGGLVYLFYKYRKIFETSEIDSAGQRKVSTIIEELLDEMKVERRNLQQKLQN